MNNILKAISAFLLVSCMLTSNAASMFYVGGLIGPGINYFTANKDYVNIRDPQHASFGWNVFAGIKMNKRFSLELGYLTLGYYENAGNGHSICDMNGKCGYTKKIPLEHFKTKLTVVNTISTQFYYLDLVGLLWKSESWRVYGKMGAAYSDVDLTSYVDVFPSIIHHVGVEVKETTHAHNVRDISPNIALGYEYRANPKIFLRSEINYFFPVKLVDNTSGENQGVLYPAEISFGVRMLI